MVIEVFSPNQTEEFGTRIAKEAKQGQVFCLTGDLGVGKTMFTKGFAKGLGINQDITSPTFTIVNEYNNANIPFYHFDVYRLNHPDELYDIGYEDYFYSNGICLIEWADMIVDFIPKEAIWIEIKKDISKGLDYRLIEVKNEDIGN